MPKLRQVGRPLVIKADISLLACSLQCVPKKFTVELTVPKDAAVEGPEADELTPFFALVPGQNEVPPVFQSAMVNNGISLSFDIAAQQPIVAPDIFIESNPEIPFSAPVVKLANDKLSGTLTVRPMDTKTELPKLEDTPITVTLIDEGHALEVPSTIPADVHAAAQPRIEFKLALILAIAGGFILNLMPCVLPVLSLKIMSVVGHGGGHSRDVRRSFLMTAAGILFSFLMLAVMTLIFKFSRAEPWLGIQFQQPAFLILLILILTCFAANMWGFLKFDCPNLL